MRAALVQIERIENYILNKMSASEKSEFEEQINNDPQLKKEVEAQKLLVEGIKRLGLKWSANKAMKSYKLMQFLKVVIPTLLVATAAAVGAVMYFGAETDGEKSIETPTEYNETMSTPLILDENDSLYTSANDFLEEEVFRIRTDRDTVIESKDGLVIYIPEGSFDTENSQVDFVVQGALCPVDIIYSGLSTMTTDGDTLETGGMFYFDAFSKGERLPLLKELVVDIPADPTKTGMQLYEETKDEKGELSWTNPKPLKKPLIPVDILDLDFYPPGYESKMNDWGYTNKQFLDSMYYSFAQDCDETVVQTSSTSSKNNLEIKDEIQDNEVVPPAMAPINLFMPLALPIQDEENLPKNIDEVIQWDFSVSYKAGVAIIVMDVEQKNGWYIFSQQQADGSIGMPTEFTFQPNKNYDLIGGVQESASSLDIDGGWRNVRMSGEKARFTQKIRLKTTDQFQLVFDYGYMACKQACFPPEFRTVSLTINGNNCIGVNPASVQTIWNQKFNNTNLATKEFEDRMPWIHRSCDNAVLELYINNLDKNLSTVDSMVVNRGGVPSKFREFALRGDGKVDVTQKSTKALNAYYKKKQKALVEIVRRTNEKYWEQQVELDKQLIESAQKSEERSNENKDEISKKELAHNTEKVFAELGMKKPKRSNRLIQGDISRNFTPLATDFKAKTPINASRSILRANVNSLGWKNVDCLMSVSRNRQNAKIKGNGKKTSITYSNWKMTVRNAGNYDQINVYTIPTEFNSYIKLNPSNGTYTYRLNNSLTYQTVVIAWNEGGMYYYQADASAGEVKVELQKTTKKEWNEKIKTSLSAVNNMTEELDYAEYIQKDTKRQKNNKFRRELRSKIMTLVFPCENVSDTLGILIDEYHGTHH